MPTVLLVDDEPHILEVLEMALHDAETDVLRAVSASEALFTLQRGGIDLVISDIRMPDVSGVQLLKQAASVAPGTPFIMMTAYADTETAIEALQHGARDYLTKPFQMAELLTIVRRILGDMKSRQESIGAKTEGEAQQSRLLFQALTRSRILAKSQKMLEIFRTIGTIAGNNSTVLITGESGTGKELVARAIHEASPRRDGPFVSVNCGAFPETLLESELFGYLRGAFTGAVASRKGLFEAAAGGSIFLDEVTEMTPSMQVKVLRVLQERKLRPLGSTAEIPVDVRVLAATNRDLAGAIRGGVFREDLYYRLAVIVLHLPALRERSEDIEVLAHHFLKHFAEKAGKNLMGFGPGVLETLQAYSWPGNVRELENTIERAVAMENCDLIQIERIPEGLRKTEPEHSENGLRLPQPPFALETYLADLERSLICQAMQECGGNQTLVADRLGVTKPSLRHKIQSLGIETLRYRR